MESSRGRVMTKGEQMLVDLGYKKDELYDENIEFKDYPKLITIDLIDKDVIVENIGYGVRVELEIEEIKAIHQCMIDYGWIGSEVE